MLLLDVSPYPALVGQFMWTCSDSKDRLLSLRIIIINASAGSSSQGGQTSFRFRCITCHQCLKLIDLLLRMSEAAKKRPLHLLSCSLRGSDVVSSRAGDSQSSIKTWPRSAADTRLLIARGLHVHAVYFKMQNCTLGD